MMAPSCPTGDDYELADQTCLMWAYERGHDDIVTLLKHYRRSDDDYSRGDYTPSGRTRNFV